MVLPAIACSSWHPGAGASLFTLSREISGTFSGKFLQSRNGGRDGREVIYLLFIEFPINSAVSTLSPYCTFSSTSWFPCLASRRWLPSVAPPSCAFCSISGQFSSSQLIIPLTSLFFIFPVFLRGFFFFCCFWSLCPCVFIISFIRHSLAVWWGFERKQR